MLRALLVSGNEAGAWAIPVDPEAGAELLIAATKGTRLSPENAASVHAQLIALLTGTGIGLVAVLVDFLAVRMRRAALAGLPLLAVYSVPAAVRQETVSWLAFLLGAAGYLALSFPLHPPGRPEKSRLAELQAVQVPTLVVQGERDTFGTPEEFPADRQLVVVPGAAHALAVPRRGEVTPEEAMAILVEAVLEWVVRDVVGSRGNQSPA